MSSTPDKQTGNPKVNLKSKPNFMPGRPDTPGTWNPRDEQTRTSFGKQAPLLGDLPDYRISKKIRKVDFNKPNAPVGPQKGKGRQAYADDDEKSGDKSASDGDYPDYGDSRKTSLSRMMPGAGMPRPSPYLSPANKPINAPKWFNAEASRQSRFPRSEDPPVALAAYPAHSFGPRINFDPSGVLAQQRARLDNLVTRPGDRGDPRRADAVMWVPRGRDAQIDLMREDMKEKMQKGIGGQGGKKGK